MKRKLLKVTLQYGARSGFSFLELQVAFIVLGIALAGLGPLVVMQSRHLEKIEQRLSTRTAYYVVPSTDEWARKLGAAASLKSQDPGPSPPPPVLTIDDSQAGYSETGSGWTNRSSSDSYKLNYHRLDAGTGSNTANWQFAELTPGWYDAQVTWRDYSTRATNAPYTVYDGATSEGTFTVNQLLAPSGPLFDGRPWQSLGVFAIKGDTAKVELTDNANGSVCADGVHLVPVQNDVQVTSLERTLTGEEVTVHVSVTVLVP